jgi:hypothetical protein
MEESKRGIFRKANVVWQMSKCPSRSLLLCCFPEHVLPRNENSVKKGSCAYGSGTACFHVVLKQETR